MNDIPKVSFRIPRLTERLCVPFMVKRSCPYFIVPSIFKGDFGFPMIPSVPIRWLDQSGLLPPDPEVCGDVNLVYLILSSPSVTFHLNRGAYFDAHRRLRFGDERLDASRRGNYHLVFRGFTPPAPVDTSVCGRNTRSFSLSCECDL